MHNCKSTNKVTNKMAIVQDAEKYDKFINDVLKEDLRKLEARLQQVNEETADFIQQRHALKVISNKTTHPNGFKSQINLGCNFFMEAAVEDTSTMLVNIGLNHYVEFTLDEANRYLDARIKYLEKLSEALQKKAAEVNSYIKLMLINIKTACEERDRNNRL